MKLYYGSIHNLEKLVKHHLFLICPNNSGSTFLKNVLYTSKKTWNLTNEGQHTFGFCGPHTRAFEKPLLWAADIESIQRFRDSNAYNWEHNKKTWYFQAFSLAPEACIFVTKSPPFLLNVAKLNTHFHNARFVFMVRNPYAVVEGIVRRYQKLPRTQALELAAKHIICCFEYQKHNIARFDNSVFFTYEEMCDKPLIVQKKLQTLIPQLDDVVLQQKVAVKGMYNENLRNMNHQQITRLTKKDRVIINGIFEPKQDLLDHFGYRII